VNDQQVGIPRGRCKDNIPGKSHTQSSLGWPGIRETVNAANLVTRECIGECSHLVQNVKLR